MAVYKRDIVDINLETGNIHRSFLKHSIGYKDAAADHFGIRVFRNGEPVSLTGVSVQGIFMPPQGDPIAITSGNIVSENEAEVVLPQACYNYDGQFTLSIKLVDATNAVTGTMRIVDGMVDNTHASGTVAPTDTVPSYQEILAVYAQLLEDVTDYESVVATQDAKIDDLKSAFVDNTVLYAFQGDFIKGEYYDKTKTNCGTTESANWGRTDKILIANGTCRFKGIANVGTNPVCVYYDSSNNYISYFSPTGGNTAWKTLEPPTNAAYVAFSVSKYDYETFKLQVDFVNRRITQNTDDLTVIKPITEQAAKTVNKIKNGITDNNVLYIFPGDYTVGGYFDKRNEECAITSNPDWATTPKIKLSDGVCRFTGIANTGTNPVCVYYDSNEEYVSYFSPTGAQSVWRTLEPPSNVVYVAFSVNKNDYETFKCEVDFVNHKIKSNADKVGDINLGTIDAIGCVYWTTDAVYYEGVRKAYYIGYVDSNGMQGIMAIDADTKHITRTPLYQVSVDDHNSMGIAVRSDGRIVAIGTSHASTKKHHVFISENPEDISYFDKHIVLDSVNNGWNTYSTIVKIGSKHFLFWRENIGSSSPYEWSWYFRSTTDFETWDNPHEIVTAGSVQYYLMVRKYDDTYIKFFMQSNATMTNSDIRLGYLNVNTYDIYDADKTTVLGNAETAGVAFTDFTIIKTPRTNTRLRIEDSLNGTDNSFICAEMVVNDWDNYLTYLMRDNGNGWTEIAIGSLGSGYGPSSYINTGTLLDANHIIFPYNTGSYWQLRKYTVDNSGTVTNEVIDETPNSNIKFIRPKAFNADAIAVNRGYYSTDSYTDFYTAVHLKEV